MTPCVGLGGCRTCPVGLLRPGAKASCAQCFPNAAALSLSPNHPAAAVKVSRVSERHPPTFFMTLLKEEKKKISGSCHLVWWRLSPPMLHTHCCIALQAASTVRQRQTCWRYPRIRLQAATAVSSLLKYRVRATTAQDRFARIASGFSCESTRL